MKKRIELMIAVNERAGSDDFYNRAQALGTLAAKSFLEVQKEERQQRRVSEEKQKNDLQKHRSQMTGLENIAETTLKVTDVLDYIKKQTARQPGWKKEVDGERFGVRLKNYLEGEFKTVDVHQVCIKVDIGDDTDSDKRMHQQVALELLRQLIRQLVVQYEYYISEGEGVKT